jgi:putative FmdB family regulatory protein
MPTYVYQCEKCEVEFEQWQSIHAEALRAHPGCGSAVVKVITGVRTYGIGPRGAATRAHDATESRWDKDLPAYKRLRHNGYQPPSVDGCATLETEATSGFEIETGLKYGHMDTTLVEESMQMARESGWDPKKKVEV